MSDLLLDRLPVGPVGVNTGVAARIREIAAKVGAEPDQLTRYRKVSYGWPEGHRCPSATWTAHLAYMGPPQTADARRRTLEGLPRNEHGWVTRKGRE